MPADLILQNVVVHTVDAARRTTDAVAVEGGRIVAVGSTEDVEGVCGPTTRVVDLGGAMVLPGFQDAHCHLGMSGHAGTRCDLSDSRGADGHLRRIAAYCEAHPDREWIVGGGWSMSDFPGGIPTAAALDAVVSDRPAVLPNRDYHGAWVNSRALELAGVTAATPDPPGGRIERDARGAPVGTLQEQAMHLVLDRAPAPTHADRMDGIRVAENHYFSLGITACQDALVDPEWQAAYEQLARAGELRLRVRGSLEWRPGGDERQLAELVERRSSGTVGRLACGNVKFFHDGVVENRTAAMLDPYLDADGRATAEYGLDQYPLADLSRFDWSVSTPDPLHQLATAVARVDPDSDVTEALLPDERLDLAAAIAAQTIGAAHACAIEQRTGSIEVGKLADLVVLDRDLFPLAPAEYVDAKVVATLVEGEIVHAAADSELSA
jgi:predicted amidohydrolase YtcJ